MNLGVAKILMIIAGIFGIIQGLMALIGGIMAINDANKNVIIYIQLDEYLVN